MKILESSEVLRRHRRATWEFQRTFRTPLQDLPRFVGLIMSAPPGIEQASVALDQVVFEPRYELVSLYARHQLPQKWHGLTIQAEGADEVRELLQAVLSEWIDFLCVPSPTPFVIYADHDEFITFLAHRKQNVSALLDSLIAAGFRRVEFVREL